MEPRAALVIIVGMLVVAASVVTVEVEGQPVVMPVKMSDEEIANNVQSVMEYRKALEDIEGGHVPTEPGYYLVPLPEEDMVGVVRKLRTARPSFGVYYQAMYEAFVDWSGQPLSDQGFRVMFAKAETSFFQDPPSDWSLSREEFGNEYPERIVDVLEFFGMMTPEEMGTTVIHTDEIEELFYDCIEFVAAGFLRNESRRWEDEALMKEGGRFFREWVRVQDDPVMAHEALVRQYESTDSVVATGVRKWLYRVGRMTTPDATSFLPAKVFYGLGTTENHYFFSPHTNKMRNADTDMVMDEANMEAARKRFEEEAQRNIKGNGTAQTIIVTNEAGEKEFHTIISEPDAEPTHRQTIPRDGIFNVRVGTRDETFHYPESTLLVDMTQNNQTLSLSVSRFFIVGINITMRWLLLPPEVDTDNSFVVRSSMFLASRNSHLVDMQTPCNMTYEDGSHGTPPRWIMRCVREAAFSFSRAETLTIDEFRGDIRLVSDLLQFSGTKENPTPSWLGFVSGFHFGDVKEDIPVVNMTGIRLGGTAKPNPSTHDEL